MIETFAEKTCTPCRGGVPPLGRDEALRFQAQAPDWELRDESEHAMQFSQERSFSRRRFCLCCIGGAAYTATGGWLSPREAFAEARGLVSLIKDSAAVSQITTHKLRDNISVLEGSG